MAQLIRVLVFCRDEGVGGNTRKDSGGKPVATKAKAGTLTEPIAHTHADSLELSLPIMCKECRTAMAEQLMAQFVSVLCTPVG